MYIISELLDFKPQSQRTDIKNAIEFLMQTQHKSCTAFLISDFMDRKDYSKALSIMSRKHDTAAIQVYDHFMEYLPNVGLLKVQDAETGAEQYIDTSSRRIREAHRNAWQNFKQNLEEIMQRSKTDMISVRTDENYVKALINLFAKRP